MKKQEARGAVMDAGAPAAIGVDGCRGRWLGVLAWRAKAEREGRGGGVVRTRLVMFDSLAEVVAAYPKAVVGVDTPIGLLDEPCEGGREADGAVRRALGKRAVCVFTPPCVSALAARTYREAQGIQKELAQRVQERTGQRVKAGITVQGFNIFWAMRDAMEVATASRVREGLIFEVHPELSFAMMHDGGKTGGLVLPKKTREGQALRVRLLEGAGFVDVAGMLDAAGRPANVGVDDVLDAHAAAWSALRRARGAARGYPEGAKTDGRGVLMQVWA